MIIKSIEKLKIDGKKVLTAVKPVLDLTMDREIANELFFPLLSPRGLEMEVKVMVGDQVKVGQLLTLRTEFYVPTYSSASGIVKEIRSFYYPLLNKSVDHLVIENDFKYEKKETIKKINYKKSSKDKIVNAIKEAGIVGMGGAGFPTYIKYGGNAEIETILLNGVECEPYLTTDYVETKDNIDLLLEGACILMKASGAKKTVIAIKNNKKELKSKILKALVNYENIELKEVKDEYPMGWERLLIKKVFKKEYENLPSEIGIIVNNVQTCISVAKALIDGETIRQRVVTFAGDALVVQSNILLPIGTNIEKVVSRLKFIDSNQICLLTGGPMTSNAAKELEFALTLAMGGIVAMKKIDFDSEACLKCGKCTQHCPANLQPIEIKLAFESLDFERLASLQPEKCCECGLCSFICPSRIELTEFVKKSKTLLKNRNNNKKEVK